LLTGDGTRPYGPLLELELELKCGAGAYGLLEPGLAGASPYWFLAIPGCPIAMPLSFAGLNRCGLTGAAAFVDFGGFEKPLRALLAI
jgi:hypothetical protein